MSQQQFMRAYMNGLQMLTNDKRHQQSLEMQKARNEQEQIRYKERIANRDQQQQNTATYRDNTLANAENKRILDADTARQKKYDDRYQVGVNRITDLTGLQRDLATKEHTKILDSLKIKNNPVAIREWSNLHESEIYEIQNNGFSELKKHEKNWYPERFPAEEEVSQTPDAGKPQGEPKAKPKAFNESLYGKAYQENMDLLKTRREGDEGPSHFEKVMGYTSDPITDGVKDDPANSGQTRPTGDPRSFSVMSSDKTMGYTSDPLTEITPEMFPDQNSRPPKMDGFGLNYQKSKEIYNMSDQEQWGWLGHGDYNGISDSEKYEYIDPQEIDRLDQSKKEYMSSQTRPTGDPRSLSVMSSEETPNENVANYNTEMFPDPNSTPNSMDTNSTSTSPMDTNSIGTNEDFNMWDDLNDSIMTDILKPLIDHSQMNLDEGKQINTEDGGVMTSFSSVFEDDRFNDGRPTIIPTIWDGEKLTGDRFGEAVERALASGVTWPSADTIEEAEEMSKNASALMSKQKAYNLVDTKPKSLFSSKKPSNDGFDPSKKLPNVIGEDNEQNLRSEEDYKEIADPIHKKHQETWDEKWGGNQATKPETHGGQLTERERLEKKYNNTHTKAFTIETAPDGGKYMKFPISKENPNGRIVAMNLEMDNWRAMPPEAFVAKATEYAEKTGDDWMSKNANKASSLSIGMSAFWMLAEMEGKGTYRGRGTEVLNAIDSYAGGNKEMGWLGYGDYIDTTTRAIDQLPEGVTKYKNIQTVLESIRSKSTGSANKWNEKSLDADKQAEMAKEIAIETKTPFLEVLFWMQIEGQEMDKTEGILWIGGEHDYPELDMKQPNGDPVRDAEFTIGTSTYKWINRNGELRAQKFNKNKNMFPKK